MINITRLVINCAIGPTFNLSKLSENIGSMSIGSLLIYLSWVILFIKNKKWDESIILQ